MTEIKLDGDLDDNTGKKSSKKRKGARVVKVKNKKQEVSHGDMGLFLDPGLGFDSEDDSDYVEGDEDDLGLPFGVVQLIHDQYSFFFNPTTDVGAYRAHYSARLPQSPLIINSFFPSTFAPARPRSSNRAAGHPEIINLLSDDDDNGEEPVAHLEADEERSSSNDNYTGVMRISRNRRQRRGLSLFASNNNGENNNSQSNTLARGGTAVGNRGLRSTLATASSSTNTMATSTTSVASSAASSSSASTSSSAALASTALSNLVAERRAARRNVQRNIANAVTDDLVTRVSNEVIRGINNHSARRARAHPRPSSSLSHANLRIPRD